MAELTGLFRSSGGHTGSAGPSILAAARAAQTAPVASTAAPAATIVTPTPAAIKPVPAVPDTAPKSNGHDPKAMSELVAAKATEPVKVADPAPAPASAPQALKDTVAPVVAPKPTALRPIFDKIPAELKAINNTTMWKYWVRPGNTDWTKVPFTPNGTMASTTDATTWRPFGMCEEAFGRGGYNGIGFVFDGAIGADGLCLTGVDLDDCIVDRGFAGVGARLHSAAR
jgi:hypothetical protein